MKAKKTKSNSKILLKALLILMINRSAKKATFNKVDNDYYLFITLKNNKLKIIKL